MEPREIRPFPVYAQAIPALSLRIGTGLPSLAGLYASPPHADVGCVEKPSKESQLEAHQHAHSNNVPFDSTNPTCAKAFEGSSLTSRESLNPTTPEIEADTAAVAHTPPRSLSPAPGIPVTACLPPPVGVTVMVADPKPLASAPAPSRAAKDIVYGPSLASLGKFGKKRQRVSSPKVELKKVHVKSEPIELHIKSELREESKGRTDGMEGREMDVNLKSRSQMQSGDVPYVDREGCGRRFMCKSSVSFHEAGHEKRELIPVPSPALRLPPNEASLLTVPKVLPNPLLNSSSPADAGLTGMPQAPEAKSEQKEVSVKSELMEESPGDSGLTDMHQVAASFGSLGSRIEPRVRYKKKLSRAIH